MPHTPGPWHYDDYRIWAGDAEADDDSLKLIASLKFGRLADNVDDDGRLIAEAPAMLEALRHILSESMAGAGDIGEHMENAIKDILARIEKGDR